MATALLSELNRALARSQGKDAFLHPFFLKKVQKVQYFFTQDGSDNAQLLRSGTSSCEVSLEKFFSNRQNDLYKKINIFDKNNKIRFTGWSQSACSRIFPPGVTGSQERICQTAQASALGCQVQSRPANFRRRFCCSIVQTSTYYVFYYPAIKSLNSFLTFQT